MVMYLIFVTSFAMQQKCNQTRRNECTNTNHGTGRSARNCGTQKRNMIADAVATLSKCSTRDVFSPAQACEENFTAADVSTAHIFMGGMAPANATNALHIFFLVEQRGDFSRQNVAIIPVSKVSTPDSLRGILWLNLC